jgi:tetratricopeptide (TPR) repeat protein
MLLPVAEILTEAQSSQVIDSIRSIHELARMGYLRSAMDEAFNAIRMAPTYLPLHTLIGDLLVKEGRQQEAINKYSVVAQAYNARGESSQAINVLRRVIQLAPMDLTVRNRLIEQLAARGHTDEAIEEYINLADIYYRLAELDTARKTFTIALRLAQQSETNREWSIRILRRMADIDMQRLDWKQALRVYEQLRTLNPDDIAIRKNLTDLNIRLGQANQAQAELDGFLVHLDSSNRRGEALPLMEALVEENPNNALLMRYLAEEYRRAGRIQDAVTQLDAVGEILLDAKDLAGAAHALEAIIAMNPPNIDQYQAALQNLKGAS